MDPANERGKIKLMRAQIENEKMECFSVFVTQSRIISLQAIGLVKL